MNQIIPLSNAPNQQLSVNLTVNEKQLFLNLSFRYNELIRYWTMGISDAYNNILITQIPLLTGVFPASNILNQYGYMLIGDAYILDNSNSDMKDYPDSQTLGTDFLLLWGDNV